MERVNMVNTILAAILSFFIPGLGQAVAGDIKRGLIFFIGAVLLSVILIFRYWIVWIVGFLYSIYVAYDAYNIVLY